MNSTEIFITIGSELLTFMLSILGAVLIAGIKWGSLKKDMEYIKRDIKDIRDTFILIPAAREHQKEQ